MPTGSSEPFGLRCVDWDGFLGWLQVHKLVMRRGADVTKADIRRAFCGDCTAAYRREMAAEGKCVKKKG